MLYFSWPPAGTVTISGGATAANQGTQITLETAGNASLSSIDTKLSSQATAANQTAQSTLFGAVTETAPASDTASSGLNGRLQRIAQRLTSLIALLPGSLGQKTSANSLAVTIASDQSSIPVTGTFYQATQPVSAASLPLPTGAATSAKQPALGTAGTPSTDVLTVQGAASMTALKVDGSAVTQPVSGTVTANAGTGTFAVSGTVTANAGTGTFNTSASQSGTWTVQPGNTANTTAWLVAQAGRSSANAPTYMDYSSTNVTTGAYVQLVASTTSAIKKLNIFSSTGETLYLATGAAASETNQILIPPGGQGDVELSIAAGTRISVKSASATASVGVLVISYFT